MAANLIFFNKLLMLGSEELELYFVRFEVCICGWVQLVLEGMYRDREHVSSVPMQVQIGAPPMLFSWFLLSNNGVIC